MAKRGKRGSWARSGRWTEREAREALSALEESGESLAAFAKREGLSSERLYRWRAKLTKQAFVEVRPEPMRAEDGGVLEVVVATGRVVRVPSDFNASALRRLLSVLEADAC
jgi:hypothetical protein